MSTVRILGDGPHIHLLSQNQYGIPRADAYVLFDRQNPEPCGKCAFGARERGQLVGHGVM